MAETYFTVFLQAAHMIRLDDPGNDSELYVAVGGVNGRGVKISGMHPQPGGPGGGAGPDDDHWWNITEGRPIRYLNHFIWREPMSDGQSTSIGLAFIDAGNGSLDTAKHVASTIADWVAGVGAGPIAIGAAIGSILLSLFGDNPDRVLGAARILATNQHGELHVNVQPGERTESVVLRPDPLHQAHPQGRDPRYPGIYQGVRLHLSGKSVLDVYLRFILQNE